jgi:hypothetical protein
MMCPFEFEVRRSRDVQAHFWLSVTSGQLTRRDDWCQRDSTHLSSFLFRYFLLIRLFRLHDFVAQSGGAIGMFSD